MRASAKFATSASAHAFNDPLTSRSPPRPITVSDAEAIALLETAYIRPEGPRTAKSSVAARSVQSDRRRQLMGVRLAPSISEAQTQMGNTLSSMLFASLNKRERQFFGLEPYLRGKERSAPSEKQLVSAPGRLQRRTADAQVQVHPSDIEDPIRARILQKPVSASRHDRARQHVAILRLLKEARINKKEEDQSTNLSTWTITQNIADTFGKGYARWYKEISSSCKCSAGKKGEEICKEKKVLQAAGDPIQQTGKTKAGQKDLSAPPNSLVSWASKERHAKGSRGRKGPGRRKANTSFPKKYGIAPAPTSREKIEDWLRKNLLARNVHTKKFLSKELAGADAELVPTSPLVVRPLSHSSRFHSSPMARADMYSHGPGSAALAKRASALSHQKRQAQSGAKASSKPH